MAVTIRHTDEVIQMIADALGTMDDKEIQIIANKVLDEVVTYKGDSFFEVVPLVDQYK
jgi:hypothetical protein